METKWLYRVLTLAAVALVLGSAPALAGHVAAQCPGDLNGDAVIDVPDPAHPNAVCMHLSSGDGWVMMADGTPIYVFGFSDITGVPPDQAMIQGILAANFPAPTISVDQGDEFYLSLTNTGMLLRPDLFDPHTVHWHGFPQAASVFDGLPESAIAINMGATLTYYYQVMEPGTYMYHCHVEATEHMQMGMLGNLYVRPAQNGTPLGTCADGAACTKFAYNDGDGTTGYDREYPIQIGSLDFNYHDKHINVQPLPFAEMRDDYAVLNGRGYPDTVNAASVCTDNPLVACTSASDCGPGAQCALPKPVDPVTGECLNGDPLDSGTCDTGKFSQPIDALIVANEGDRVLLRISNLNVTRYYTLATLGLQMQMVGRDAKLLRGPAPAFRDLTYVTNSVTLGGGESADAIVTAPAFSGGSGTSGLGYDTYIVYTTNLNYLSNKDEAYGGMMTEIRVFPAGTLDPQAVAGPGGRAVAPRHTQLALGIE